jgi:hypothetical protein
LLLTEPEIQQVIEQAKTTFPNFTDWEYNNEKNEGYSGFSLWGQFVLNPEDNSMPRCFFITFDTNQENWYGYLTIGQPCYFWSSADVGDAHLLHTEPCQAIDNAMAALKTEIVNLFSAFSVI